MHTPTLLMELGAVLVGLALLARVAGRLSIPAIPLYLLAGLAFGEGGILPLVTTENFIEIGAEIGLILLLLMLGLEYSASELVDTLRSTRRVGLIDFVSNFVPGFVAGLVFGWDLVAALFLGGITYVSSSGVAAKLLQDRPLGEAGERGFVLSILIFEDLAMALYLPLMAALVIGGLSFSGLLSAGVAIAAVIVLIVVALRLDVGISRVIFSRSDEVLVLTILGLTIFVAGVAEAIQVSAAVGALLVGILLSGPAAHGAHSLLRPLRDLFAAFFFAFFGLSVDPASIPGALIAGIVLAVVTGGTKLASARWSARSVDLSESAAKRVGAVLFARGEFSIAIASLAVASGLEPRIGPIAVTYVLIMLLAGPLLAHFFAPHKGAVGVD